MKAKAVLILSILLLSTATFAHGGERNIGDITDLEIKNIDRDFSNPSTPADNWAYGFKRFSESLSDFFTFDQSQKIKLHTKLLEERAKEINDFANRGKNTLVLVEDYKKQSDDLKRSIENFPLGKNVSSIVKESSDSLERSIIVLQLVQKKVPENAKTAIERAVNKTIEAEVLADLVEDVSKENFTTEQVREAIKERINETIEETRSIYYKSQIAVTNYYLKTIKNELDKIEDKIAEARENNNTKVLEELLQQQKLFQEKSNPTETNKECVISGCSSQLCVPKQEAEKNNGIVTTCEYKEEYACLKETTCEYNKQSDKCAWLETPKYLNCLDKIKKKENYCLPESRKVEACIEVYKPVCGYLQVECITTPCNPVQQTFSNSCFACSNERVIYWIEGECPK